MAKVSAIDKNHKRQKKSASMAARRARLKAIIYNRSLPIEERFQATLKLAELPRNSARVRVRNRCRVTGRGAWILSETRDVADCLARSGIGRSGFWCCEIKLVRGRRKDDNE